ncbi:hypothetical protein RDJLphi1_gp36 [Roseobacter phage RDJL Phi 1]|uniref:Uncharacterized protein n=1 Tax=Roseobacter phage RDJL Phi 1 TaxID=562742 RepID=F4YXP7_9CAUD|nr:hypothetical protein RDJLphi1_gp36 [Roseobacter phage RDJL Phi 1]ADK73437.1 hypothetical protein RDJLphi1_gp36 [Roseobacter phage RDJL Phi 1]
MLRRPKILVEAANHMVRMSNGKLKTRSLAVVEAEEQELNDARLSGVGNYSGRRHIELVAEYITIKRKEQDKCT